MTHEPFLLSPAMKDYLWGGTRLKDGFSKETDLEILAETWECSTHPDGHSIVESGPFKGRALIDVLKENPDFIGTHPDVENGLPILVKFIDAKNDLSVQVHPDDEYAAKYENGQKGKSEMWYVVEAKENARLIYGFKTDITKEKVKKALEEENLEHYLLTIPVKKGDVFYIPAGQVHAICSGCLIAEVQESSNLTYRLYDYNREDKFGNRRELHIEKALDVMNLNGSEKPVQPMRFLRFREGIMIEKLYRCKYFNVEKVVLDTQRSRKKNAKFKTRDNSFRIVLCVEGCGTLFWTDDEGNNKSLDFYRGDCIFVPADSVEYRAHGRAELLRIGC